MTKPLVQLMQKQMTRKEFVITLGLGIVAVLGFDKLVELFTGHSIHKNISTEFGIQSDASYGGIK
jgi:hypothetical protein